ncbi:glutathionylspermidine synthase [Bacteriophage DSS3_PM1]|nr:glutathionylspermidine synthase [Bacteriophage DSS3_PM1]
MEAFVKKPIFSREGSSIEMIDSGVLIEKAEDMSYADNPSIIQEYAPIESFDGNFPVIGAWIVGDECVGMGLREDHSRITQDLSRFTPHTIVY